MKNVFGNNITVTLFGESHGAAIGAVLDGLSPGIEIDAAYIAHKLDLRRPSGKISTKRREADEVKILSGVYEGKTTGTPLCLMIENTNTKSADYGKTRTLARPSHADYAANCKYHGYEDFRGGGHFSGRITAALVAAGAILQKALEKKGIFIGTHVSRCAGISDRAFSDIKSDINALDAMSFAVLDENKAAEMVKKIEEAAGEGDSVGGVLESAVLGMPAGVGEPWFDTLEGMLSHALFSIPAVKGVEFGAGFAISDMRGSEANDVFRVDGARIVTATNNSGGIQGGISNGMPIIFRCAVKPTPSIYKVQDTVDFVNRTEEKLQIEGRHDPAIVHRARVVVDSVTALVISDMLVGRFGTDFLGE